MPLEPAPLTARAGSVDVEVRRDIEQAGHEHVTPREEDEGASSRHAQRADADPIGATRTRRATLARDDRATAEAGIVRALGARVERAARRSSMPLEPLLDATPLTKPAI